MTGLGGAGSLTSDSVGVVLSVSRSRLKLPVQLSFLICHGLGVSIGMVYNNKTPDFYENNAHHKLGWVITWVVVAQSSMGMATGFVRRGRRSMATGDEHDLLIPVSVGAVAKHHRLDMVPQPQGRRYSNDSGQGTERASSSLRSHSWSPVEEDYDRQSIDSRGELSDVVDDGSNSQSVEKQKSLRNSRSHRFPPQRVFGVFSDRVLGLTDLINDGLDRVILVLGFVAIATGVATYFGLFVSHSSRPN